MGPSKLIAVLFVVWVLVLMGYFWMAMSCQINGNGELKVVRVRMMMLSGALSSLVVIFANALLQ